MAEPKPDPATPEKGAVKGKGKRARAAGKKEKKSIPHAVATVQASFNNTVIAIADQEGGILAWSSAGRIGFKGSRKGTPFAAQLAAANCAEGAKEHGVRSVDVRVTGPGAGRGGRDRVRRAGVGPVRLGRLGRGEHRHHPGVRQRKFGRFRAHHRVGRVRARFDEGDHADAGNIDAGCHGALP